MAFKASKERRVRISDPKVKKGTPLRENAGHSYFYYKQLEKLNNKMFQDMEDFINTFSKYYDVKMFFTQDAILKKRLTVDSSKSDVKRLFNRGFKTLRSKYAKLFKSISRDLSENFVSQVSKHANNSVSFSIGSMGLIPTSKNTEQEKLLQKHVTSAVNENVDLIKSVHSMYFDRIKDMVYESLDTKDPAKAGVKGIKDRLMNINGMTKRQASLIARDQTKKVYESISTYHLKSSGIDSFEWLHSSAGKVPRHSHEERNGKEYLLKGGEDELFNLDGSDANVGVKDSDKGKPGYAINCRCTKIPVYREDD